MRKRRSISRRISNIEEIGRTKLGLVKPGEILLKPDSEKESSRRSGKSGPENMRQREKAPRILYMRRVLFCRKLLRGGILFSTAFPGTTLYNSISGRYRDEEGCDCPG